MFFCSSRNVFHYLALVFHGPGQKLKSPPREPINTHQLLRRSSEAPASSALPGAGSTGCRGRHLGATCPGGCCPGGHAAHGERLLGDLPSIWVRLREKFETSKHPKVYNWQSVFDVGFVKTKLDGFKIGSLRLMLICTQAPSIFQLITYQRVVSCSERFHWL